MDGYEFDDKLTLEELAKRHWYLEQAEDGSLYFYNGMSGEPQRPLPAWFSGAVAVLDPQRKKAWRDEVLAALGISLDLEVICSICNGSPNSSDDYGRKYKCQSCDGSGYMTTELGEKVLSLMRHHFKPMHDDLDE